MSGIVCKVWNINGNTQSKQSKAQLSDSVNYILNPEKTGHSLDNLHFDSMGQLTRECKYVENDLKTFDGAFVGGVNVSSNDIKSVVQEMMEVKNFYEKPDGRTALHMIISLDECESDISNAGKLLSLCNDVLKKLFPNNQAVFAVHTNTDNLHAHLIINSVGLNGKKIHQDNNFIKQKVHTTINQAAKRYGFTQNAKWQDENKYSKTNYVQLKIRMRKIIDDAIDKSGDFDDFLDYIHSQDITVRLGKFLTLKFPEQSKGIRTYQLGQNYSLDKINDRIMLKKESLKISDVGQYALDKEFSLYNANYIKLKKYKDMTDSEKKDIIKKLKMGRNPWRENGRCNWQLNRIANIYNVSTRMIEYVNYYSSDGSIQGTLDGINEARAKVEHEKKMILYAKKKYAPIIAIYQSMKKYERAAYLYEYCDVNEFRNEHEKYRDLTCQLKNIYGKDVFEVEHFMNECADRELLASSQTKELSNQYLEVKRYAMKHGEIIKDRQNLIDAIEYYADKERFKNGVYEGGMNYIASRDSGYVMLATRSLYKGKNGYSIYYNIDVYDSNGKVVNTITEYNGNNYEFGKNLEKLQQKYNFYDCNVFTEYTDAMKFSIESQKKTKREEKSHTI